MELKEFLKIIKKRWILVTGCLLVGLLGGVGYFKIFAEPHWEATALLFVTRTAQETNKDYYTYDGFHAQQTAYHYADTVIGLAKYLGADKALRKSEQLVEVTKVTQVTRVTEVTDVTKDEAEKGLREMVDNLISLSESLNKKGDPEISVQLVNDAVAVEEVKANPLLVVLVGMLAGLGIGVLLASLKEYLS